MTASNIEWTDATWNCVVGCSRVSAGCSHCYAERVAHRGMSSQHKGLTKMSARGPQWTGEVRFLPAKLAEPLSWKKPRKVFVNSMSDLFHEQLSNEQIAAVFGVMAACPQHTFQVLTKRPARMLEWFKWLRATAAEVTDGDGEVRICIACADRHIERVKNADYPAWPLPNVVLGVSAENQETADERIPLLIQAPAAVHAVSAEPLLGPIDFEAVPLPDAYLRQKGVGGVLQPLLDKSTESDDYTYFTRQSFKVDWVIVGGESGPGSRPCDVAWVRGIVRQCKEAGVSCFVKQLGTLAVSDLDVTGNFRTNNGRRQLEMTFKRLPLADRKGGGDMAEWPADLRVREFPRTEAGPHA